MNRKQLIRLLREKHKLDIKPYNIEYLISCHKLSDTERDDYGNRSFSIAHADEIAAWRKAKADKAKGGSAA